MVWFKSMSKATAIRSKKKDGCRVDTLSAENERFVRQVKSMSTSERVGYMIEAGIYTKDGKLTPQYRD